MIEQKIRKFNNVDNDGFINNYIKEENSKGFIVKSICANNNSTILLLEREITNRNFEVGWTYLAHNANGSNDYKCDNCGYTATTVYIPVECPMCHGETKQDQLPINFG